MDRCKLEPLLPMNPETLVAEFRKIIGNDHAYSSYVLGFVMGLMVKEPEITLKAALEEFLRKRHKK